MCINFRSFLISHSAYPIHIFDEPSHYTVILKIYKYWRFAREIDEDQDHTQPYQLEMVFHTKRDSASRTLTPEQKTICTDNDEKQYRCVIKYRVKTKTNTTWGHIPQTLCDAICFSIDFDFGARCFRVCVCSLLNRFIFIVFYFILHTGEAYATKYCLLPIILWRLEWDSFTLFLLLIAIGSCVSWFFLYY